MQVTPYITQNLCRSYSKQGIFMQRSAVLLCKIYRGNKSQGGGESRGAFKRRGDHFVANLKVSRVRPQRFPGTNQHLGGGGGERNYLQCPSQNLHQIHEHSCHRRPGAVLSLVRLGTKHMGANLVRKNNNNCIVICVTPFNWVKKCHLRCMQDRGAISGWMDGIGMGIWFWV